MDVNAGGHRFFQLFSNRGQLLCVRSVPFGKECRMAAYCLICGRKLNNPQSKASGYGPVCYRKKFGIAPYIRQRDNNITVKEKKEADDYNLPGQISVEDYLQMLSEQ